MTELEQEIFYYEAFLSDVAPSGILDMLQEIIISSHISTHTHLAKTACYVKVLAIELGFTEKCASIISCTSSLHDIAKISLPLSMLDKSSALSEVEYNMVKRHTTLGHNILSKGTNNGCRVAAEIALSHHEWFGGGGYPNGIRGYDIPLPARITAVADVFEALTDNRRYKEKWPVEKAFEYIETNENLQFDPDIVEAFLSIQDIISSLCIKNKK